jgi:hypothetical protein
MPIPQFSVNSGFDQHGWGVLKQDVGSLCRNVNGKASALSFDSTSTLESTNVQSAIEELDANKASNASLAGAMSYTWILA